MSILLNFYVEPFQTDKCIQFLRGFNLFQSFCSKLLLKGKKIEDDPKILQTGGPGKTTRQLH